MTLVQFAIVLQEILNGKAIISTPKWSDAAYGGRERIAIFIDNNTITTILPETYWGRMNIGNTVDSALEQLGITLEVSDCTTRKSILEVENRKFELTAIKQKKGSRWTFEATEL